MIYVLVVLSGVYFGNVVAMQEFGSKQTCEAAADWIKANARKITNSTTICLPKSDQ